MSVNARREYQQYNDLAHCSFVEPIVVRNADTIDIFEVVLGLLLDKLI